MGINIDLLIVLKSFFACRIYSDDFKISCMIMKAILCLSILFMQLIFYLNFFDSINSLNKKEKKTEERGGGGRLIAD